MKQSSKVVEQIHTAVEKLELSEKFLDRIQTFDHVHKRSISIEMDCGGTREFEAFRIQHSNARGPYKGGVRFHQDVTEEVIRDLAMEMTLKGAVVGIPVGGGKGGVRVDPKELSRGELERLARGFIREFFQVLGPTKDVPAPDVGTNAEVMGWMMDEYERLAGESMPGVVTGKPLAIGGSEGRSYATAQGGFYVLGEAVHKLGIGEGATVSIQGFGNAGYHAARILDGAGYKVISVSDSKGTLVNEDGLDIGRVWEVKQKKGAVSDAKECGETRSEHPYSADIFIPAALADSVGKDLAEKLESRIVLELANGPLTAEADAILAKRGTAVIPDILANAGGVIVSYFEQVQNASNFYWKEAEVLERLEEKIRQASQDVWERKERHDGTLREAAVLLAVERVAGAMSTRGR